jgi:sugar phosphate isomerase/epimerase
LEISALSCHGNPLHPNAAFAKQNHEVYCSTVALAVDLGVETVINFSGCPGGCPEDRTPNWITCPWPTDFSNALKWQWDERAVPYWAFMAHLLRVRKKRVAFEPHPGFVVYNTETVLKLREQVGALLTSGIDDKSKLDRVVAWMREIIHPSQVDTAYDVLGRGIGADKAAESANSLGANFDPSHLFWQQMDPIVSARKLGEAKAIFHVHAKDCRVDAANTAENGVLDNKHYGDVLHRSWVFRTVGYGHGPEFWKDFVSVLRCVGYDGVLSIEHEDGLMSVNEGFQKAVAFLRDVMLTEPVGKMWWA